MSYRETGQVEHQDYLGWTEIMSGPSMSEWIETNDESLWIMICPDLYWLHPKLYVWWKLRYR